MGRGDILQSQLLQLRDLARQHTKLGEGGGEPQKSSAATSSAQLIGQSLNSVELDKLWAGKAAKSSGHNHAISSTTTFFTQTLLSPGFDQPFAAN